MEGIAIIIVAAGSSSRMKKAKQLLPWGKTSLLGNAIEQAKSSLADEVITVLGANYEKIKSEIEHFNITIVENKHWKQGIGSSIAAGIKHILQQNQQYQAALLLLADQPLMDFSYLNQLIEVHLQKPSTIIATQYPRSNGVPAVFPKAYFEELSNLKLDVGAKSLLNNKYPVITLNAGDKTLDIDTPEDYRKILKITIPN